MGWEVDRDWADGRVDDNMGAVVTTGTENGRRTGRTHALPLPRMCAARVATYYIICHQVDNSTSFANNKTSAARAPRCARVDGG